MHNTKKVLTSLLILMLICTSFGSFITSAATGSITATLNTNYLPGSSITVSGTVPIKKDTNIKVVAPSGDIVFFNTQTSDTLASQNGTYSFNWKAGTVNGTYTVIISYSSNADSNTDFIIKTFKIGPAAPTIVSITAVDGDGTKKVKSGDKLLIAFNSSVSHSAFDLSKITVNDGKTLGTSPSAAWNSANTILTITLGTNPTLTIANTISVLSGNGIEESTGTTELEAASGIVIAGSFGIGPAAPTIVSITAVDGDGTKKVKSGDKLLIAFNSSVSHSAFDLSKITVNDGKTLGTSPSAAWNSANTILTITLGTNPTLTIANTISVLSGNGIEESTGTTELEAVSGIVIAGSFGIGPAAPTIVSITAVDGDGTKKVKSGDKLLIAFNSSVSHSAFDLSKITVNDGKTLGTSPSAAWNSANTILTITLGTNPTLTIANTISVLSGNGIEESTGTTELEAASGIVIAGSFGIGPAAPTIVSITAVDGDGTINVKSGDKLLIAFNSSVLHSAFDLSKITVNDGKTLGTSPSAAWNSGNTILTITLGTNPTLTITNTITVLSGNGIEESTGTTELEAVSGIVIAGNFGTDPTPISGPGGGIVPGTIISPTPKPTETPRPTVAPTSPPVVIATPAPIIVELEKGTMTKEKGTDGTVTSVFSYEIPEVNNAFKLLKEKTDTGATGAAQIINIDLKDIEGAVKLNLQASALLDTTGLLPNSLISVQTVLGSYVLPLSVLNFDNISKSLGDNSENAIISIKIGKVSTATSDKIDQSSKDLGISPLGTAVDYTVSAESNGKTFDLNNFGTTYVDRSIIFTFAIDENTTTAVVFDPETGKLSFVPAVFTKQTDGSTEVIIKRNGNSAYSVATSNKTFNDVNKHWAKADIELLASKLIVTGTTSTSFAPENNITRAEFAALLVRSLGLANEKSTIAFTDVKDSDWYAGTIGAAVKAKLVSGFEDNTFKPNNRITREQMAVMISRAAAAAGQSINLTSTQEQLLLKFSDKASIHDWAKAAVSEAVQVGIVAGVTNNTFVPSAEASRAEAVVMLKRMLQYVHFIN